MFWTYPFTTTYIFLYEEIIIKILLCCLEIVSLLRYICQKLKSLLGLAKLQKVYMNKNILYRACRPRRSITFRHYLSYITLIIWFSIRGSWTQGGVHRRLFFAILVILDIAFISYLNYINLRISKCNCRHMPIHLMLNTCSYSLQCTVRQVIQMYTI